jgi:hypothetical protein
MTMNSHIFKCMPLSSLRKWIRNLSQPSQISLSKQVPWSRSTSGRILLESQSTMYLFCNSALVSKTCKSTTSMRLIINAGTMVVTGKSTMSGYNKDVWFNTRAITNIIALINLIQQYHVTYDSDDKMFVVHRESQGKPNMEFCMHKCGLHFYDPRNEKYLAFLNTVSENKEGFTKRQIKGAELA